MQGIPEASSLCFLLGVPQSFFSVIKLKLGLDRNKIYMSPLFLFALLGFFDASNMVLF